MPTGIYIRTPDHRRKIGNSLLGNKNSLGFKHSQETRKKMSLANKGKAPHVFTEATRIKMSNSRKGKSPWNKGLKNWRAGYKHSEETKRKIALGNKKENQKSTENELLRKSTAFKNWRRQIFLRDSYTCQECGAKTQKGKRVELHPHHIKEFSLYPELRFEISNGLTLCKDCHSKKHNIKFTNKKAVRL